VGESLFSRHEFTEAATAMTMPGLVTTGVTIASFVLL